MDKTESGGMLPQLKLDELLTELQARLQAILDTRDRMRGLLEAVVAIGSGLEVEAMLSRISPGASGGTELVWRVPVVAAPEEEASRPAPQGRYPLS